MLFLPISNLLEGAACNNLTSLESLDPTVTFTFTFAHYINTFTLLKITNKMYMYTTLQ